jgi:hypothetical protein
MNVAKDQHSARELYQDAASFITDDDIGCLEACLKYFTGINKTHSQNLFVHERLTYADGTGGMRDLGLRFRLGSRVNDYEAKAEEMYGRVAEMVERNSQR